MAGCRAKDFYPLYILRLIMFLKVGGESSEHADNIYIPIIFPGTE